MCLHTETRHGRGIFGSRVLGSVRIRLGLLGRSAGSYLVVGELVDRVRPSVRLEVRIPCEGGGQVLLDERLRFF